MGSVRDSEALKHCRDLGQGELIHKSMSES